jgi:hypothetical protein
MRVNAARVCWLGLALVVSVLSTEGALVAGDFGPVGVAGVPEIGGGALVAGLGVLSAGVMVLRARRKK